MEYKHFTGGNKIDFIKSHESEIIELFKGCIPLNNSNKIDTTVYDNYIIKIIDNFAYKSDNTEWFFLLDNNVIQSMCFVANITFVYKMTDNFIPTSYVIYENQTLDNIELLDTVRISPVIYSLCKRKNTSGTGRKLLEFVFTKYKEYSNIYLIQESILFKDNYSEIYDINNCLFIDLAKYKESNNKLSSYYQSVGFKIIKNYFDVHKCSDNSYIFFNVFVKDLHTSNKYEEEYKVSKLISRLNPTSMKVDKSKIYGAIYGVIYGDAFGSRYEFMTKDAATIQVEKDKEESGSYMIKGGGFFNFSAGQVTDDSEMMFALLDAILDNESYDQDKVALNYIRWYNTNPIDKGKTITKALDTRKLATNANDMIQNSKEMNYSSLSNGTLMRIIPIGIYGVLVNDKELKEIINQECDLTHPNKLVKDMCFVYCLFVKYSILGYDKKDIFDKAYKLAEYPRTKIILKDAMEKPEPSYISIFSDEGNKETYVDTDDKYWQGYIGIALQNAIYEFMNMDGNLSIIDVAKRGGDTDTNCAITGGLVGAYHGLPVFDSNWYKTIKIASNSVKRYKLYPFLNPLSKMERSSDMLYNFINNNI